MLGPAITIARNTFTESIRQPIYLVLMLFVIVLMILGNSWAAYTMDDYNKLMIDMGLSLILLWGTVLAAFIASGVIAREIENKTVLTVISKPIGRPAFVLGKYFGVAAAMTLAMWVWAIVFLMVIRHKVMSSNADEVDWPVISFGFGALAVALIISVWGNYFYNWVFNSTFVRIFPVAITLAYLLVLVINKNWQFQPITTELIYKTAAAYETSQNVPQIMLGLLLVGQAALVLGAVAVAASTRLGQVMTLLICLGAFFVGAAADAFFGRHQETNDIAWALYRMTPNVQFFFLADALTQNHPVSLQHVGLVSAYAALFVTAILGIAVALFQTRETG